MSLDAWFVIAIFVWLVWVGVAHWLLANPRGDTISGLVYRFIQVYSRFMHRIRVHGREHIPTSRNTGPMIVVCNHTAGIDPMLVQSACRFYVRWMMAEDMKWGGLAGVWSHFEIIFVDRTKPDSKALREAVRAIRGGEVIGVFPEGKIERPRGQLLAFQSGVGAMVALTGAPVLPMFIRGTPDATTAWGSFSKRSESEMVVGEVMRFTKGEKAEQVVKRLEAWFAERT